MPVLFIVHFSNYEWFWYLFGTLRVILSFKKNFVSAFFFLQFAIRFFLCPYIFFFFKNYFKFICLVCICVCTPSVQEPLRRVRRGIRFARTGVIDGLWVTTGILRNKDPLKKQKCSSPLAISPGLSPFFTERQHLFFLWLKTTSPMSFPGVWMVLSIICYVLLPLGFISRNSESIPKYLPNLFRCFKTNKQTQTPSSWPQWFEKTL